MRKIYTIIVTIFLLFCAIPFAQSATPLEISADHALIWNTKTKTYTAEGTAIAKQGDMTLNSDTITAHYADGTGSTDITKITATGNIIISAPPYTAYAQNAVYDLATGIVTLTGDNLKITTPDEIVTARDKIEFNRQDNKLTAFGHATATRGTDQLTAQTISAFFTSSATTDFELDKITAQTNVTIQTKSEKVYGSSATYQPKLEKAMLLGPVKIQQGQSIIEGSRAEVDLKTGLSKLFAEGNIETRGRVKGVFYPK